MRKVFDKVNVLQLFIILCGTVLAFYLHKPDTFILGVILALWMV